MIEMRDGKKVLVTPVSREDLEGIHVGDILYLDGDLMTCRDVAHRRLVEGGLCPMMSMTRPFFTPAPSSALFRGRRAPMKWYPWVRRPPCGWKNSNMNS